MVSGLNVVEKASLKRNLDKTVGSKYFEVVAPYEMRERREDIYELPYNCLLLKTCLTGICHADLRYVSGSRPAEVLRERLPMCVFHEGVAQVKEVGDNVQNFSKGDKVVVVPNIPCYVHNPEKYPDIYRACKACRPEGAGENLCEDVKFLGSNAQGLSRTYLVHPASCVFPLPDCVPEEIAVLTEPLTVVYRAVMQTKTGSRSRVAVLGGGFMGYLTAAVLSQIIGVRSSNLLVTDIFDFKLDKVRDFATVLDTREKNAIKDFKSSYDLVFECVGGRAAATTINQASSLLAPNGTCVLMGVSEEDIAIKTRVLLEKGLILKGTTRSAAVDYPEVLNCLEREEFQKIMRRIIYPEIFEAKDTETIVTACRTAEKPETHGKIIIDWHAAA